jgi:hypothetical protein
VDQYVREGPSLDEEDGVRIGRIQVLAMEKGARRTKKPRAFKVHDKVNHLLEGRRNHLDFADDNDYIFTHPLFSREKLRRRNIGNLRNTYTKAMDARGLRHDSKGNKPKLYISRHTNAPLSRNAGKSIDDIPDDIGNRVTTAQRFYIGQNTGERKGLPLDIDER